MKMKKILALVSVATISMMSVAKDKQPRTEAARVAALPPAERAARLAEAQRKVMEMHGGVLDCASVGVMAVVNCQKRADLAQIKGKVDDLRHASHMTVELKDGSFTLGAVKLPEGVNVAVFVVDDPSLPMSLVSVEEKWGMMNVAPLLADAPDASKIAKRLEKQFVRVASLTFGGGGSQYSGSPLRPVFGVRDLDAVEGEGFTIDVVGAISRNLSALGFKARRRLTYRRACQEGWAPAPTNAFQKAVWDQVHAVPKDPMKIEFDPKKGR